MLSEGRTALVLAATGESEMETGEVPNRGVGRLEAYWTGVMERVKKQSEVHLFSRCWSTILADSVLDLKRI
jgi:hypothetical protein